MYFYKGRPYYTINKDGIVLVEGTLFPGDKFSPNRDPNYVPFPLALAISMGLDLDSYKDGLVEDTYLHDYESFAIKESKLEAGTNTMNLFPHGYVKHFCYIVPTPTVEEDSSFTVDNIIFTFLNGMTHGYRNLYCHKSCPIKDKSGWFFKGNLHQSNKVFHYANGINLFVPLYKEIYVS